MITATYPLPEILEVMKPCHLDMENPTHVERLEEMMADGSEYVAEEKIDGCHYNLIDNRFFSTRISKKTGLPVEKTYNFPHLVKAFMDLNMPNLILDGEINYPGMKSQHVITVTGCLPETAIARQEDIGYVHYTVFDILRVPGGRWVVDNDFNYRRHLLETLFRDYIKSEYIHLNPMVYNRKEYFLDGVLDRGAEGIVLKDISNVYRVGKRPMWNWIKIKVEHTDDAVIMGFEPPTMEYTGKDVENWPYWTEDNDHHIPVTKFWHQGWVGAMILGKYDIKTGELVRVGTTSGFDESMRRGFSENQNHYIGKVVTVNFMEMTPDGAYRHPAYVGIHTDKNPKECVL